MKIKMIDIEKPIISKERKDEGFGGFRDDKCSKR
jgi:hypothetical protein